MVHVYCDESGSLAPGDAHFSVAAVAIPPEVATRMLKSFCKRAKVKGNEIKGSHLNARDRRLFLEILEEHTECRGVAVMCVQGHPTGNWARGEFRHRERVLYRHMIAEACASTLIGLGPEIQGITADQGRYKRAELDEVAKELEGDFLALAGRRVPFSYAESHRAPGLQIADVLCNAAGKLYRNGPDQAATMDALSPMMKAERLVIRPAELRRLAPSWLLSNEAGWYGSQWDTYFP